MNNQNNKRKSYREKRAEQSRAVAYLKAECLSPGDSIVCFLRRTTKAEMRYFEVCVIGPTHLCNITIHVAKALDVPYSRRWDALRLGKYASVQDYIEFLAQQLFGNFHALDYKGTNTQTDSQK